MRSIMRATASVTLLLCLLCAPLGAQQPAASLSLVATGLKSDRGALRCALFSARQADAFPTKPAVAQRQRVAIKERSAACVFTGLVPGDYAAALYHDEDDNGRLNTNFIGIPNEGMGASRDPKGSFGPPSFEDARFTYGGDVRTLKITMRY
jgi:uncharacterized protein (DUF2141 family)